MSVRVKRQEIDISEVNGAVSLHKSLEGKIRIIGAASNIRWEDDKERALLYK